MRTTHRSRHDVVIVDARVAGVATAMLPARLGMTPGGSGRLTCPRP